MNYAHTVCGHHSLILCDAVTEKGFHICLIEDDIAVNELVISKTEIAILSDYVE